jgi:hypothetical protein
MRMPYNLEENPTSDGRILRSTLPTITDIGYWEITLPGHEAQRTRLGRKLATRPWDTLEQFGIKLATSRTLVH